MTLMQRQQPSLGAPARLAPQTQRREPQLPAGKALAAPSREPALIAVPAPDRR